MKRSLLFLAAFTTLLCHPAFAAPQAVSGPTANLNATGIADGADFQTQVVQETTLTVPDGFSVNTNGNADGITTSDTNKGNVIFSGNSTVFGNVGQAGGRVMDNISGGANGSTVSFNGIVSAGTGAFNITGNGIMQFNSTANGAIQFNNDGFLILGTGATFNGAVNNLAANTGTLTLNSASTLNGAVGAAVGSLKKVNVVGGNATVVGSLSATNFSLGTNTLQNTGALALPVNTIINTTVISNTLFGKINTLDDQIAAPIVTVNVDASQALITPGQPLFVVGATSGTSGRTIHVTSNAIRYTFVGLNLNGNIEIIPTLVPSSDVVTNPVASAVGTILNALLPIAAANPGSDLTFIQLQLNTLTTAEAYQNALLQISPASGLIGIGRESFNTTKQFQKILLEHLLPNRCRLQNACSNSCDPCANTCNPCCNPCESGFRVWADGFGYYGHQDNKDDLNGYKANTWGTMLSIETPVICGFRAGLGGGYAYTDLDERKYGNNTNIHNYQGTVYFSYDPNAWFLDGGFSFGWNRYDGKRHINFAEVNRTARAKYNGKEYTGFAATGYRYTYNCFDITPIASVLYSHLHLDAYTEKGAQSLNLHINKQHYNYLESSLGAKVEYLYQTRCGTFIPEIHSFWLHDFYTRGLHANATFTWIGAANGSFNNIGPRFDKNTWNMGGSITCFAGDRFSFLVLYDYERSKSYFDHQVMLEASYEF
jgi:uncharacterized protein with beta-barrel porin domain